MWVVASLCAAGAVTVAGSVRAEPLRLRGKVGAARALSEPQTKEFGWGGVSGLGVEVKVAPALGLQLGLEGLVLTERDAAPASFASQGTGRSLSGQAEVRIYMPPTDKLDDAFWLSAGVGAVRTGTVDRPGFHADLGYDIALDGYAVGPFVGYRQIIEPSDSLRPEDARVGAFGVQGAWDPTAEHVPPDIDGDGILNEDDKCPRDPEDKDGFQDKDGCPDADNDGDKMVDTVDKCPNDPEDFDDFMDADGCPDKDNDEDGILDVSDKCPIEAEDKDGFEDEDGCPDLDNDKDGMPDAKDHCPDEPETVNGYAEEDGCPDEVSVRVVGASIRLDERIHFDYDKASIRAESRSLIERVATLLNKQPEYLSISIEGHTDEAGDPKYNLKLSQDRADAVRDLLVEMGVDPLRLTTVGFGKARPLIQSNKPEQVNRRVEFIITRKRKVDGRTVGEHGTPRQGVPEPEPNP